MKTNHENDPDEIPWVEKEWKLWDHKLDLEKKVMGDKGIQHAKDEAMDETRV